MAKPNKVTTKTKTDATSKQKRMPKKAIKGRDAFQQQRKKEAMKQKNQKLAIVKAQQVREIVAERERIAREKQDRIKEYKKKRLEKTKAISKRTNRGQPLMKDRMQLLLKQIQDMKRNS